MIHGVIRVAILDGPIPGLRAEAGGLPDDLLHPREQSLLSPRAVPKRRDDFVRGRVTARQLLAEALTLDPAAVAVVPDRDGVPWVEHDALGRLPVSLSLSHTEGVAAAAMVDLPIRVGIDVEQAIATPDRIVQDYFQPCEAALCARVQGTRRSARAGAIWALKEAGLKSLGTGLRLPTSAIVVLAMQDEVDGQGWSRVEMVLGDTSPEPGGRLRAWIRTHGDVLVALCARGDAPGHEAQPASPSVFTLTR